MKIGEEHYYKMLTSPWLERITPPFDKNPDAPRASDYRIKEGCPEDIRMELEFFLTVEINYY